MGYWKWLASFLRSVRDYLELFYLLYLVFLFFAFSFLIDLFDRNREREKVKTPFDELAR